jgi:DNA-binding beta-propeller fold protein YncE
VWPIGFPGVVRIDPATNAVVATIPVGHDPFGIAFGAGAAGGDAVWVSVG